MCSASLYDRRCLSVCYILSSLSERQRHELRRWKNPQINPPKLYKGPKIDSMPSVNHDYGCDNDGQYTHMRDLWSNLYSPPPSLVRLVMVSKDVLVESPHSLTMYLKLMFREAVNLRVVIDCVLCVYTFVLMMIMIHVQMTQLKLWMIIMMLREAAKYYLADFFC